METIKRFRSIMDKVFVLLIGLVVLFSITHLVVKRDERQKEIEIERKLELIDWGDLSFDFINECEKSLNKINGFRSFISTKKLFTDKEMAMADMFDVQNETLSTYSVCEMLNDDAVQEAFRREFISVEEKYDPSDYNDTDDLIWRP